MKIAKFTINRKDIDPLIYKLEHLKRMADKHTNARFVAINFLEHHAKGFFLKFFKKDLSLRVVVQIDRYSK